MKTQALALASLFVLVMAAGCSTARELEVTGEVTSAQAIAHPITLEFFEVQKDAPDAERVSVKKVELAKAGAFTETIEASEDVIIAHALVDADGDGACTAGELWAEAQQEAKEDGTLAAFQLALEAKPCPAKAE
ncbi:MAG: hypothetical protein HY744_25460 [Deltaproteobacteria bacterium]|nr:hypothetical protein [Deltaproteobacteria bacterium]